MRALWFARYCTAGGKVMWRVEDFRPDVIEFSFLTIEYKLTRMFQEQFADLCPGATVIVGGAPVRVLSHPHCRVVRQRLW